MRESHGEDRAPARPGLYGDGAVAALDHVVHDGKAQPVVELARMPRAVRVIQLRAAAQTLQVLAEL